MCCVSSNYWKLDEENLIINWNCFGILVFWNLQYIGNVPNRHSLSRPLSFSLCNWIISSRVLLDCIFHINHLFTFDLELTIIGLYLSHQTSFYYSSSTIQIHLRSIIGLYFPYQMFLYLSSLFHLLGRMIKQNRMIQKKII